MPDWYSEMVQKALAATGRSKSWCGDEANTEKVLMDWLSADGRHISYYSPGTPTALMETYTTHTVIVYSAPGVSFYCEGPTRREAFAAAVVAVHSKESKDALDSDI